MSRKTQILFAVLFSVYVWFFYMAETYAILRWPYLSDKFGLLGTVWAVRILALVPLAIVCYGIWTNDQISKRIDDKARRKQRELI